MTDVPRHQHTADNKHTHITPSPNPPILTHKLAQSPDSLPCVTVRETDMHRSHCSSHCSSHTGSATASVLAGRYGLAGRCAFLRIQRNEAEHSTWRQCPVSQGGFICRGGRIHAEHATPSSSLQHCKTSGDHETQFKQSEDTTVCSINFTCSII